MREEKDNIDKLENPTYPYIQKSLRNRRGKTSISTFSPNQPPWRFYIFVAALPNQSTKSFVECTRDVQVFRHDTPTWDILAVAEFPDSMTGHAVVIRDVIMQQKQANMRVQMLKHIACTYNVKITINVKHNE